MTPGARAADRPVRQAAPIEYARICDAFGTGFFYIPGSDRCLPAGGLVPGMMRVHDLFYRIAGPLFYVNGIHDVANGSASAQLGGFGRQVNTFNRSPGSTAPREMTIVRNAFIQFAGLTSGRAPFMFDSYADANNCENLKGPGAIAALLAYTATFGDGLSSTLFLAVPPSRPEPSVSRIATTVEAPFDVGGVLGTSFRGQSAGTRVSEIVGNLRLDQPWGGVKVPDAAHPEQAGRFPVSALATIAPFTSPAGFTPPYVYPALTSKSYGFAIQGGVQVNLDYLSPSDKLWLQAAYEKGAAGYAAGTGFANANSSVSQKRTPGSKFVPDPDSAGWNPQINFNCAFAGSGKCEQQSSWDITGAYKNFWLPILKSTTFGSTLEVRKQAGAPSGSGSAAEGANRKEARIEPSLFRSPLRGFDIGAEYMYAHLSQTRPAGTALDSGVTASGFPAFSPNTEVYEGRLRVQHGF